MIIKEWPLDPLTGQPETEHDVLVGVIIQAPLPKDVKIRLMKWLPRAKQIEVDNV